MATATSFSGGLRDASGGSTGVVSAHGRSTASCSTYFWHGGKGAEQCPAWERGQGKSCLLFTGGEQKMQLKKRQQKSVALKNLISLVSLYRYHNNRKTSGKVGERRW